MTADSNNASPRRWPIAVAILALLAFEVMRELYVLKANEPRFLISPPFTLSSDGEEVEAQGIWKRSDGGSEIVQGSVVIRCVREWGACIEVNNSFMPDITALNSFVDIHRDAVFSADAVEFVSSGGCATYRVRMDLGQKRVTATRDKLPDAPSEKCGQLESRVAMEMVNGDRERERASFEWAKAHFLPIRQLISPLLGS